MGKRESYVWSLQRVVETDMGSWTARDEPLLTVSLKSAESVGPIDCEHGLEDVFQVNFKSGKTIHVNVPKQLHDEFLELATDVMEQLDERD